MKWHFPFESNDNLNMARLSIFDVQFERWAWQSSCPFLHWTRPLYLDTFVEKNTAVVGPEKQNKNVRYKAKSDILLCRNACFLDEVYSNRYTTCGTMKFKIQRPALKGFGGD